MSPRAYFADDPGELSLDGTWFFDYHRSDPNPDINPEVAFEQPLVPEAETMGVEGRRALGCSRLHQC